MSANLAPVAPNDTADTQRDGHAPGQCWRPVIVVGAGPVGVRVCQELIARDPERPVLLFGDEPWAPYDRIRLSSLLAGDVTVSDIELGSELRALRSQVRFIPQRITQIDRAGRRVLDAAGESYRFHRLILATGSTPHIPDIPGIDLQHVYTFRDLADAHWLSARQARSRHTVVIGGGLLGLEAARAMRRANTRVTVVQQSPRLLNRQLDAEAAALMQDIVTAQGIAVRCGQRVMAIRGDHSEGRRLVSSVVLRDGTSIDCDTVIVAAGIKPNLQLAMAAKLSYAAGITVDDRLQTSDPDIYAVGECIQHRGVLYGLVAPGYEQAGIAAAAICDAPAAYHGSLSVSQLKVINATVFSLGEADVESDLRDAQVLVWRSKDNSHYRKLVLHRGRLIGAMALGEWQAIPALREAVTTKHYIMPWLRWLFLRNGEIDLAADVQVSQWSDTALVCNCRAVTCGALREARQAGAVSVVQLQECTGAGTVCGSCVPLLENFSSGDAAPKGAGSVDKSVAAAGLMTLLCVAVYLAAGPVADITSMQSAWRDWMLWRDGLWKQITGFSVLGIAALSLLMSAAKRRQWLPGSFIGWRRFHVFAGVACLLLLVAHSGNHWGSELNRLLMSNFIALGALGALVAAAVALESRFGFALGKSLRRQSGWLHLVLFWPLPALLGLHIFSVYYF